MIEDVQKFRKVIAKDGISVAGDARRSQAKRKSGRTEYGQMDFDESFKLVGLSSYKTLEKKYGN